jgi:polyisoprenoid-binding protein YceI
MMTKHIAVAALALSLTGGSAVAAEWQIDPAHSSAQFSVKHMMVSTVRGNFQKVSGTVSLDDQDVTKSSVEVTIDAASIDTREPKRDAHLKSPDFFDVAKYPTLTFKSTKIEKAGKDKFKVTGELTMHGQTHPVMLLVEGPTAPIKTPWGTVTRGVSATGKLNRKDWGLNWNKAIEAGGVLVGDEVQLQIDAEMGPKPAQAAQK